MSVPPGEGFRYTRLYADAQGESHFEDVVVAAERRGDVALAEPIPVSSIIMRRIVATEVLAQRHNAPRRQFIVHLEGSAEVEASDGERRRFGPGDVVLVEDTSGRGHTTHWADAAERRVLFIPLPE